MKEQQFSKSQEKNRRNKAIQMKYRCGSSQRGRGKEEKKEGEALRVTNHVHFVRL